MSNKLQYVCICLLVITTLFLSACNNAVKETSTLTSTTSNQAAPYVFPDQGTIWYDGKYYSFQRLFEPISSPTNYNGVIFAPKNWGGATPTGPIAYWYVVTFADEIKEELEYVGFASEDGIDVRFTKHDNPHAGVILAAHEIQGGLSFVTYLLVSTE
jgi:hypothetical protein